MPDPIIHEYHYPGGPPTLEYMLGEEIPAEHTNLFETQQELNGCSVLHLNLSRRP